MPPRKSRKPASRLNRRKRVSSKPSKSFAKKVLTVLHKTAEDKSESTTNNSLVRDCAVSVIGDAIYAIPSIAKGTQDNQRNGDQITARKLTMKGHLCLNLNYQNQASCRIAVRMMVVQPKTFANIDSVATYFAQWMPYLLKRGGTVQGFTGSIENLYAGINTDLITKYYDKTFYMSVPALLTSTGTTDVDTMTTSDNRQSIKFFKHTFKLRNKVLKFDSNVASGLYPTNYAPVILVGFCRLDGSAITADTQVQFNNVNTLYWEDI